MITSNKKLLKLYLLKENMPSLTLEMELFTPCGCALLKIPNFSYLLSIIFQNFSLLMVTIELKPHITLAKKEEIKLLPRENK
jgi:hypothetical protein